MLKRSCWDYVQAPSLSGELERDITGFLTINGKPDTAEHCISVAKASRKIAVRFGLDETIASTSALLHDISNAVRPEDMLGYAMNQGWAIDASEEKYPFLLHQRLSAVFAKEWFGINDPAVLSAIGCHTTLKENPSSYDMTLFLADKIAWDQEGIPPFLDVLSVALEKSLIHASDVYINFVLDHGMILFPHQWFLDAKKWLEGFR